MTEERQALAMGVQAFRSPSTTTCRALRASWIYLTDGLYPWFLSGKHGSGTILFLSFEGSPFSDSSSLTSSSSGQGLSVGSPANYERCTKDFGKFRFTLDMFSLVEMRLEGLEESLRLQIDPLISVNIRSKGRILCSIKFIHTRVPLFQSCYLEPL